MEEKTLFEGLYRPQPLLIVISGTSGVGKDAVLCGLKELGLNLHFVVTATSRPPRPLEVPGVDYFFYTREDFERRIANNEFIEYTMVYSDWKGIPRSQVDDALRSGKDVVLRVDVQGAMKLRKLYPEAVLIFLIPESVDEWYNRLRSRNTDSPDERARIGEEIRQTVTRGSAIALRHVYLVGHKWLIKTSSGKMPAWRTKRNI